jgi:hypothetical protein
VLQYYFTTTPGGQTKTQNECPKEQSGQRVFAEAVQISRLCTRKEWKGRVHPRPPAIPSQGKEKVERTDPPQSRQERPQGDGDGKGLYSRMAWLLLCGRHGAESAKLERMAAQKIPHVHLEAMEEAENKDTKLKEIRNTGVAGIPMGQFPTGLLAHCWKCGFTAVYNERKARTGGIL